MDDWLRDSARGDGSGQGSGSRATSSTGSGSKVEREGRDEASKVDNGRAGGVEVIGDAGSASGTLVGKRVEERGYSNAVDEIEEGEDVMGSATASVHEEGSDRDGSKGDVEGNEYKDACSDMDLGSGTTSVHED
jgi:hypothetical protein